MHGSMFLSLRWESNPQPSDLRWDALTIELPGSDGREKATMCTGKGLYVRHRYSELHIYIYGVRSSGHRLGKKWKQIWRTWKSWVTSVSVPLRGFYVTRKHERPRRGTETDVTQSLHGRHIWLHSVTWKSHSRYIYRAHWSVHTPFTIISDFPYIAHHFSKKLAGSWLAPLKVNDGG